MTADLTGKTVFVAGGASGAGIALARRAAERGASVHIVGRNRVKLETAQASIGARAAIHQADITIEAEVAVLARELGPLDHLVVTAAHVAFKPFLELSDAEISAVLAGKLWGPIYLIRHLAPKLAKDGSITLVSGTVAYKASPGASIVAAANAALDGFARTLSLELAPVRVNVVSPGIFDSPTWDFLDGESRKQVLGGIGDALPVGRVGRTEDIAEAILFAMGNGFLSGSILQVDGGNNA